MTEQLSVEDSQILDLAIATFGYDRSVRVIRSDHTAADWTSVSEAVAAGASFTGPVKPGIVALDVDSETLHIPPYEVPSYTEKIVRTLKCAGLVPVVVQSGRAGHRHVFAWANTGAEAERLRQILTVKCRVPADLFRMSNNRGIRPPLSPHHLGLTVALLGNMSVADAIEALTTKAPERAIPEKARLIAAGQKDADYMNDRGTVERHKREQGFIASCANAGCSVEVIYRELMKPGNRAGAKLGGLSDASSRRRRVEQGQANALRMIFDSEPIGDRFGAMEHLVAVRDEVAKVQWSWPGARSERLVLGALLDLALDLGTIKVGASIRQLLELTPISSKDTVAAALKRLIDKRLLIQQRPGTLSAGAVYRFPDVACIRTLILPTCTGEQLTDCPDLSQLRKHEAFAQKGLGTRAYFVLMALTDEGQTNTALQLASGYSYKTVRAALGDLADFGIAEKRDHVWRLHEDIGLNPKLVVSRLDEAAKSLGTSGRLEKLKIRHALDRAGLKEAVGRGLVRRHSSRRTFSRGGRDLVTAETAG